METFIQTRDSGGSVGRTRSYQDRVTRIKRQALESARDALLSSDDELVTSRAHLTMQMAESELVLDALRAQYIADNKARKVALHNVRDANTNPIGHEISQVAWVDPRVHEIDYEPIYYALLMPVSTEASDWARTITYFSGDMTGAATWFSGGSSEMRYASEDREKKDVTVSMAALGYEYDLEEMNQALMIPGLNLTFRKAASARFNMEKFLDAIALNGDADKGYDGLFNQTNVTKSNSAIGNWSGATPAQILADVNTVVGGVYSGSNTTYMADTLLIPPAEFSRLAGTQLPDTSISLLEYVQKANVYTASTGRPLTIRGIPGLENAAAGSRGRAVAYANNERNLVFHMPMPHTFLPVWQKSPLGFEVPAIARTGGLEIRRTPAFRYLDQITA